jgi:hypothetical protein
MNEARMDSEGWEQVSLSFCSVKQSLPVLLSDTGDNQSAYSQLPAGLQYSVSVFIKNRKIKMAVCIDQIHKRLFLNKQQLLPDKPFA